MAAAIAGGLLVNRALRPTISRSLAGPAFLDVAKSCGNPNFLPAPSLPRLEFKSGDFKPELIAPSACPRSVGRTAGVGDQPRRCCRGPKRAPIVGIATGLIGHAQHRLDRRPLRGVLCRAIDLGERVFANLTHFVFEISEQGTTTQFPPLFDPTSDENGSAPAQYNTLVASDAPHTVGHDVDILCNNPDCGICRENYNARRSLSVAMQGRTTHNA